MPKLDGVSATSLIRQFDHRTPIISMTSNSCPQDILNYYSHGMNDILPKPFTRDGLLGMLEKHLMHLKAIQQMTNLPRTIGPPDNTNSSPPNTQGKGFKAEDAPPPNNVGPAATFDFSSASMIPDDQYNALLNMTMGMGELFGTATATRVGIKRTSSDLESDVDGGFAVEDGHVNKRGRFEVVE
jgi:osomolarity two-component system response regulator SKN7